MESIHCKIVHYNNDIRRILFAGRDYDTLKATIVKLFSLNHEFILKYLDDEGDYITLSSQNDLVTALEISPTLLRIKIGTVDAPVTYWECKKDRKDRKRERRNRNNRNPQPGNRSDKRRSRAEKKLTFVSECLKELGTDDSKLTPRDLKKKQRLLRKQQCLELFLSEGHFPKRERRVLTPEEEKLNATIKSQILEIRTEVKKIKTRQRDLKLVLQNNPGDAVIMDELSQLKEKKSQYKTKRRSLCDKLHSQ